MADRAITPPPSGVYGQALSLTPEQVRQREANRLAAKAKLLASRQSASSSLAATSTALRNINGKRALHVIPADSTSPTAPDVSRFDGPSIPGEHDTSKTGRLARSGHSAGAHQALQDAITNGPSTQMGDASRGGTRYAVPRPPRPGPTANREGSAALTGPLRPASMASPDKEAPLPKHIELSSYVEYDLSTLKNSKGGFLVDDEEEDEVTRRQRAQADAHRLKRLQESERMGLGQDPALSTDSRQNSKCNICGTIELDFQLKKIFGVSVCAKCKYENPERYSLLTKTECKDDYLLTDPELRDEELLPHLLKPNPHRSNYSNMMLFLREQVEAYAFSDRKWGSPEALDKEFERRQAEKKAKKGKKFEAKLLDLKKKTRTNVWHRRKEAEHVHDYTGPIVKDAEGQQWQRCAGEDCAFKVQVETF
ncbi:uncharacterized protein L969DRAFT_89677 [Mixia osmundae IAM 14324]|uniref:DNA repair protein RAD14 n=1 Tax=Mixia osmundae (strain CBS 9802 / IAM 14324 / JCM 22182 / KY 12970) TaxID=764103 RepID=G7E4T8_MIXOS|nr:uncharacterized protein L969DRAFT_89677 [Mixia osmundae IAM 14324]KEI37710.1 hypothetical protein L969DRAFT_89677 [Mixia osmundae IAM 14324]GAA97848.1 hypothetical protein E5Q_04528 [Mixia osmundae IAM 14324]